MFIFDLKYLGREFFVKRSMIPSTKLVLGIEFLNVPFTENYVCGMIIIALLQSH